MLKKLLIVIVLLVGSSCILSDLTTPGPSELSKKYHAKTLALELGIKSPGRLRPGSKHPDFYYLKPIPPGKKNKTGYKYEDNFDHDSGYSEYPHYNPEDDNSYIPPSYSYGDNDEEYYYPLYLD